MQITGKGGETEEGERMASKTWRPRGGKPPAKMRDIEFDIKTIREIQERKKRVGKGHKKQSEPRRRHPGMP